MTIELSLGCKSYPWIEPLIDGDVSPTGVDLTVVDGYVSPDYFSRLLRHGDFDAAELSLGSYLAAMDSPEEYGVSAIPVFPHRRFRHSFLYVRAGSEYERPSDLNGATVGMPNWQFAAGLWLRGILGERHGLDLRSVEWKTAGSEIVPLDLGSEFDVTGIEMDYDDPVEAGGTGALKTVERLLADGEIDAAITPTEYRSDGVERLFDDPFDREREYYRETGVFPIMHLIAVDDDVLDDHPWVANELYEAFVEAEGQRTSEYTMPGWFKRSPLVWSLEALEDQFALFDGDPWEFGLTPDNRRTLETAVRYAADQDLVDEPYDVEDLFVDGVGENPFTA
ncbi:MAG: 4,5-dihydroxyphthalate decarboxylase [Haloarculaceae archaeon]